MRVAVTGANGFVGRHVVGRLLLGRHEEHDLLSDRNGSEQELYGGGS